MSLNAATIEVLIAKGLSAADLLDVARATEVKADPTNAERQARFRKRKRNAVTVTEAPPNEDTSNPDPLSEPEGSFSGSYRKPEIFVCPPSVDSGHWRDFMANRKRKNLAKTETAYRAILDDIAKFADDEWPPGRLVQHAAAKGWGSINDPRSNFGNRQNGTGNITSLRGTRPDPSLDLMRQGIAEERAERGEAPHRGTGAALPAIGSGRP